MRILGKYLKQMCELQVVLKDDDGKPLLDMYGNPQLGPVLMIPCRKERKTVEVLTISGSLQRSEYQYYVEAPVQLEDRLNGKAIIAIAEMVDLKGVTVGYECTT